MLGWQRAVQARSASDSDCLPDRLPDHGHEVQNPTVEEHDEEETSWATTRNCWIGGIETTPQDFEARPSLFNHRGPRYLRTNLTEENPAV